MTNKRKADCTPEEWAAYLEKQRQKRARYKAEGKVMPSEVGEKRAETIRRYLERHDQLAQPASTLAISSAPVLRDCGPPSWTRARAWAVRSPAVPAQIAASLAATVQPVANAVIIAAAQIIFHMIHPFLCLDPRAQCIVLGRQARAAVYQPPDAQTGRQHGPQGQ